MIRLAVAVLLALGTAVAARCIDWDRALRRAAAPAEERSVRLADALTRLGVEPASDHEGGGEAPAGGRGVTPDGAPRPTPSLVDSAPSEAPARDLPEVATELMEPPARFVEEPAVPQSGDRVARTPAPAVRGAGEAAGSAARGAAGDRGGAANAPGASGEGAVAVASGAAPDARAEAQGARDWRPMDDAARVALIRRLLAVYDRMGGAE